MKWKLVVVDFEVSEVYHINLLIPQLLIRVKVVDKVLYLCLNMHVQCWTWFSLEMTWFIKMIQMWRRVILCDLKSVSWQVQNTNIGRTRGSLHSGNLPRTHCENKQQGDTCYLTIQGGSVVSSDARTRVPRADFVILKTYDFDHAQMVSIVFGLDWIWIYFFFPRHIYLKA